MSRYSKAKLSQTVRRNIKKYRKLRNYTQEELANKCSMTREYISRIESDKGIKYFSLYT